MRHAFYDSPTYREKQRKLTQQNQVKGLYIHLKKTALRSCARPGCSHTFPVVPSDPKRYCSSACSAKVHNSQRKLSDETKRKIAASLRGRPSPYRGVLKVPRTQTLCGNPACINMITHELHRKRRFCSNECQMKIIGGKPTSPKASRGKAGIRKDISDSIYFYSRWEANIARLYTYLGIEWKFSPTSFDIGGQMYTPDFYLPETDIYVEVKNFWGEYSRKRDENFRKTHKNVRLEVILKDAYLELEKQYAHLIPQWEYKNSPF